VDWSLQLSAAQAAAVDNTAAGVLCGWAPPVDKAPTACDVGGCLARCATRPPPQQRDPTPSDNGGDDGDDAYYCSKGCAGMSGGQVTDKWQTLRADG
jgi:hypothetical protein